METEQPDKAKEPDATIDLSARQLERLSKTVSRWNGGIEQLLGVLARAGGGKALTESPSATGDMAYLALMSALDPIMLDQLENREKDFTPITADTQRLLDIAKKLTGGDKARAGALNRMIMVTRVETGACRLGEGATYIDLDLKETSAPFAAVGLDRKTLADYILAEQLPAGVNRECVVAASVPVLVASCDYAQNKVGLVKLVAGMLIKDASCGGSESHKENGSMRFSQAAGAQLEGRFRLVLDSRYATGRTVGEMAKFAPTFRLRQQVVVAVQAWCGAHGARPGHTSVPQR